MPTYIPKILENHIMIEFQENEDKALASILEEDDCWHKVNENCWRAPYSMRRAEFAKRFCENPKKCVEIQKSLAAIRVRHKQEMIEILEKRKIEHFVHFTNAHNLESILKYGLLSVREMQERGITYISNDNDRFDAKLGGISLSVSFPNYRMFYKKRQTSKESDWVILLLDPNQIVGLTCRFYAKNAACSEMKRKGIPFNAVKEFENMFCGEGVENRENKGIPSSFTTDPQAEVLVLDAIPVSAIQTVCFANDTTRKRFNNLLCAQGVSGRTEEKYFDKRIDYKHWGN